MKIYKKYIKKKLTYLNDNGVKMILEIIDLILSTNSTIKYVDSFEKLSDFIDNCGIKEDIYYEEIEVE